MGAFIAAGNFYSIENRLTPCTLTGLLSQPVAASEWFDIPILLLGIYHTIAWLRVACLGVCAFLNINLMHAWYVTSLNTLLLLAALLSAALRINSV
jgi:hypothetical protein